jgi:hypothetical protein
MLKVITLFNGTTPRNANSAEKEQVVDLLKKVCTGEY